MSVRMHAWGSDFDELASQVRAMMNEMESPNFFRSHAPDPWVPRLNLYERPDRFVLCVELAGVPHDQVQVLAEGRVLLLRGVRRKPVLPEDPTNVSVHVMEIDSGPFQRRLPLPRDVIVEAITTAYREGLLWITLPRDTGPQDL